MRKSVKTFAVSQKTERVELIIRFPMLFGDTPTLVQLLWSMRTPVLQSSSSFFFYRRAADERRVLEAEVKYMLGDRTAVLSSSIWASTTLVVW